MEVPLTPLDFLARARRLFPDRVGVIERDREWTYGEFADRCDRMARLLSSRGVKPGDVVAWLGPNTHELLEAYYGVLLAEAVLAPLNIRLHPAELRAVLDDARPAVLVRHPGQADPGHGVSQLVLGDDFERTLSAQPSEPLVPPAVDENAPAELFYTSGSTGRPKGALLSHRGLYLHAVHNALTNGIGGHDVILHTIPLFHVNGWGTAHYLTLLGGTHVMLERFDPGDVLALVEKHRVTRLFLVPTMLAMLLDHPGIAERDLSSVVSLSVGGAPPGPDLLAEAEEAFGADAICGYGMTEASPTLTRSLDKPGSKPSRERRATTGLPIVGVDARVLDTDDREVPWDGETVGEICARSNHVMIGYLDRPQETAEALRDGWLRTGDLATVDTDGYFLIVDRKKDLIISGGENISSVEVEHALAAHPAVAQVAVVGMPDERWGEVPRAFVTLRPGASAASEELGVFVAERLARFKLPRRIDVLDSLPVSGTGKIDKIALRAVGPTAARPG